MLPSSIVITVSKFSYISSRISVSIGFIYLILYIVGAHPVCESSSSAASNGVIVITTIRPKSGQIRVSLNANYNISVPDLRDYNLMNAEEKLEYERLAGLYQDTDYLEQCKLDELYNSRLEEVRKGVNTYWLSQPLTTSSKREL